MNEKGYLIYEKGKPDKIKNISKNINIRAFVINYC
jgi:hypothetical protein